LPAQLLAGYKIPWSEAVKIAVDNGNLVAEKISKWGVGPRSGFLKHYKEILGEIESFLIKEEKEIKKDKELAEHVKKLAEKKRIKREEKFRKVFSVLKEKNVNLISSTKYKAKIVSRMKNLLPLDLVEEYAEAVDKSRRVGILHSEVVKAVLEINNIYEWLLLTEKSIRRLNYLWKEVQQKMKRILGSPCKDKAKLTETLKNTVPFRILPEKFLIN